MTNTLNTRTPTYTIAVGLSNLVEIAAHFLVIHETISITFLYVRPSRLSRVLKQLIRLGWNFRIKARPLSKQVKREFI